MSDISGIWRFCFKRSYIDSTKYFDYISKKLNADNILKWMEWNKQFLTNWHERYNIVVFKWQ